MQAAKGAPLVTPIATFRKKKRRKHRLQCHVHEYRGRLISCQGPYADLTRYRFRLKFYDISDEL